MVKIRNIRSSGLFFGSIIIATIVLSTVVFGVSQLGIIAQNNTVSSDNEDSEGVFKEEILRKIDCLIEKVENSSDDCWWEPICQRKAEIINKSIVLKELINLDYIEKAYDKLLHEIKPKLTGLKTDEDEHVWGNEVFNNSWVICDELKEEFRVDCNELLTYIRIIILFKILI